MKSLRGRRRGRNEKRRQVEHLVNMIINANTSDTSANASGSQTSTSPGDENEQRMKSFVESMVVGCLFIGTFVEKWFVPELNEYRHVIKIDESEQDTILYLKAAKKKIKESYPSQKWIGFTDESSLGAPAGCSVWTTLSEEILGKYWFKIQSVHFHYSGVEFKLQIVRPYESKNVSDMTDSIYNPVNEPNNSQNSRTILKSFLNVLKHLPTSTPKIIMNSMIFLGLSVGRVIRGSLQIIHYLLEYIFKLLKLMPSLIIALTPMCITLINALSNIIFGFYKLIAYLSYLFKGESQPTVTYLLPLSANNRYQYVPIRYALPEPNESEMHIDIRDGSGVQITELE